MDAGYLTACDFSFLDEVGKSSPTLGHDLLAAPNERIKHEVGPTVPPTRSRCTPPSRGDVGSSLEGRSSWVGEEMADVLLYLVRLADVLGVDLADAARQKLAGAEIRFPKESVRGVAPDRA